MEMTTLAVYAAAYLKDLRRATGATEKDPAEALYDAAPGEGLRAALRVASAIGAVALFAGFLTVAAH